MGKEVVEAGNISAEFDAADHDKTASLSKHDLKAYEQAFLVFENYELKPADGILTKAVFEGKSEKIPELFKIPSLDETIKHADKDASGGITFAELVNTFEINIEFTKLNVDGVEGITDFDFNS